MAKHWHKPGVTMTGAAATLSWIAFLKTHGVLAHQQSGNAAGTFSQNPGDADVFTPTTMRSWGRYQMPNGVEFVLQSGADGTGNQGRAYRTKYSHSATFNQAGVGAATAHNVPPSATDQQFLGGSGNDAQVNPDAQALYGVNNTFKIVAMCDDAAPYGWWVAIFANTTGAKVGFILFDPLRSGTFDGTDAVPYVLFTGGNSAGGLAEMVATNSGLVHQAQVVGTGGAGTGRCATWWRKGLSGEAYGNCPATTFATVDSVAAAAWGNSHVGQDSITQLDVILPVGYMRHPSLTPNGYKGMSSLLHCAGTRRANMSTLSVAVPNVSKEYLAFGDLALDWDGTDPVL